MTDIVAEQVGAGSSEPAPTPAVGEAHAKTEEVDQPGGLEKVDEAVEEVKEAEAGAPTTENSGTTQEEAVPENQESSTSAVKAEPDVLEEGSSVPVSGATAVAVDESKDQAVGAAPDITPAPERKQERIQDPTYTLEVVGNRYKTDAFW